MSWQATTAVIANSKHKGSELLCLIMLSNYADPEGGSIFPSLDRLAGDCRMSRSTVQRCIRSLVGSGELVPCGFGPEGVNRYAIRGVSTCYPGVKSRGEGGVKQSTLGGVKLTPNHVIREQSEEEQEREVSLFPEQEGNGVLSTIPFESAVLRVVEALEVEAASTFIFTWAEFVDERKKRKKPLTDRAARMLGERLAEQPQRATLALRTCIEREWLRFEWAWLDKPQGKLAYETQATTPKPKIMLSAAAQRLRRRLLNAKLRDDDEQAALGPEH